MLFLFVVSSTAQLMRPKKEQIKQIHVFGIIGLQFLSEIRNEQRIILNKSMHKDLSKYFIDASPKFLQLTFLRKK